MYPTRLLSYIEPNLPGITNPIIVWLLVQVLAQRARGEYIVICVCCHNQLTHPTHYRKKDASEGLTEEGAVKREHDEVRLIFIMFLPRPIDTVACSVAFQRHRERS